MTASLGPNIVIVVVTGDRSEYPASPAPTAARPAEPRTRQDHAQADTHPPGTPGEGTE